MVNLFNTLTIPILARVAGVLTLLLLSIILKIKSNKLKKLLPSCIINKH